MVVSSEGFMVAAKLCLWKKKRARKETSGCCCRFGCRVGL